MTEAIINEIVELHEFFESWLTGSIKQSRKHYARFENAMANDLTMVPPGSSLLKRDVVMEIFWQQHGSIKPPFRIEVRNPAVREVAESLYFAIYEEWQFGLEQTARVTTALLTENQNGIQWLSVHESWLPEN